MIAPRGLLGQRPWFAYSESSVIYRLTYFCSSTSDGGRRLLAAAHWQVHLRRGRSLLLPRSLHPPRRTPRMMLLTCMSTISDSFIALKLISLFLSFTPADSDANWIESLSRADVPRSTVSNAPPTNAPTSSFLSGQAETLQSQVTSLQTTVASVQSENSSLRSSLSRLETLETGMSVYMFYAG
jgi:hypothetical protein